MRYEIEVNGRVRQVDVQRAGDRGGTFVVAIDGRRIVVDAARLDPQTLSMLVGREGAAGGGSSHEAVIVPDPAGGRLEVRVDGTLVVASLNGRRRWGRRDAGRPSEAGPERIVAPMPGKIARVLVQTGEAVRARQPLVVVEAMKMENELRAGRDGTVAEIRVQEGAPVDAGALLVVVR